MDKETPAATGVAVIAAADRGGLSAATDLRDAILEALSPPEARVVVDLSEVILVDAGMLRALVSAASAADASRIAIVCPETHQARQMFRLTALDDMFALCETRADAVRALTAS